MTSDKQTNRLENIVTCRSSSCLSEPVSLFENVFGSSNGLDFAQPLLEVVTHASSGHDLCTLLSSVLNIENVLCVGDPLLEPLSHHYSISHVSYTLELTSLSIRRTDSHCLLSLLLSLQSVHQVLIFILQVFSLNVELSEVFLVSSFLPLEESL